MLPMDFTSEFKDNPLFFGFYFLSHHFRIASPDFHLKLTKYAMKEQYLAIQAPRESAKSTILTFLHSIHGITFKRYRFIVIVQNTFNKAAGSLDTIKKEFKDNDLIKTTFHVEIPRDAQGDSVFRHTDGFETRVLCKGADQIGSVRGEKFGAYRPDLIIIDDLEDDELVRNPERRIELKKLYDDALIPAGEFGKVKVLAIGTILHDDSLMRKLVDPKEYPEYTKLFYKAREVKDGVLTSLWPQKWTLDALSILERDKPETFAKEYMGDPSQGSMETIQRTDFRYWKEQDGKLCLLNEDLTVKAMWDFKECRAAIACDLAWEDKKVNDFSAIVPGIITPQNDLLIDTYIAKRGLRPDELEQIIFDLNDKYVISTGKRVQIGFEKAKLEKVMKWFLTEAQRRRNKWLWFKDINWGTKDKIERIVSRLGNRYAQHSVFHRRGMGDLENQLVRLRSTAHDDIADAVGMLPELLSFAPKKESKPKPEDKFDFLMKQTPGYRDKFKKENYIYGNKQPTSFVNAKVTYPI